MGGMKKIFSLQNIIFLAVAAYLVFVLVSQQSTLTENINRNIELKSEIAAASEELSKLEEEEEIIDTDEYIERRAREELGYVKNDEIVFIRQ